MSIIAISDNLVLLRRFLSWIFEIIPVYTKNDLVCKVYVYTHHIFSGFGAYIIVSMTFDKFYAVTYPHKANIVCTRKRVYKFAVGITILVCLYYLPTIFTAGHLSNTAEKVCARFVYEGWYIDAYGILLLLFYPIVPVIALFFFNISIIRAIYQREISAVSSKDSKKVSERQITVMLLFVSSMFIVLLLPFEISNPFLVVSKENETPEQAAQVVFIFQLTFSLMMLNYCINFYLYLLSGFKFRNDLKNFFGCGKPPDVSVNTSISQISGQITESEAGPGVATSTSCPD